MKKVRFQTALLLILVIVSVSLVSVLFSSDTDSDADIVRDGAAGVVPSKETLIENLLSHGYTVSESEEICGLDVSGTRVCGEKGGSFIDICYGLSMEEAENVFSHFEERYTDYYILARNDAFVYCVSDKQTFRQAGFTSTANVGIQYIRGE